jgi:hypothetical protein
MDNYSLVSQPKRLKVSLYPHQLTSIFRMEELERNQKIAVNNLEEIKTRIGILSDLTGYGKTLSVLGLIERDNMEVKDGEYLINKNKQGNNLIFTKKVSLYNNISSNLIILNPSLLSQWEQELQKTDLKYTLVNSKKNIEDLIPSNFEVVLCNQSMYSTLISRFRKYCWKRLIIDEPQGLKIQDWNNFAFHFIWLVTATPYALLIQDKKNNNGMYQELFSENENLFSSIIIRNPDAYVKSSFLMPENLHFHYYSYNPINRILEGIVSPVLLELISAGNIREAIKFLGGNVQNPESLYLLVKNKKLEKLKEIDLQISVNINLNSESEKLKKLNVRRDIILEQIKNLENKLNEMLSENCIVCNERLENPLFLACCQNILCGKCILTWMEKKDSCILCRSKVQKDHLIYIQKSSDLEPCFTENSNFKYTKPQLIQQIITQNKSGKFIIFSNYDESFETVKRLFDEGNIKYSEIKGGKDSRSKSIHSYKYEDCQVLFLNSKNNASGINLEETTDIILYHSMNDFAQTQILGRANRIGRTNILNVHHLN